MRVLMVGVDKKAVGGMWTVVENYLNNKKFCEDVGLIYIPTATSASVIQKLFFSAFAIIKVIYTLLTKKIDIVHVHMAERGSVFREGIIVILGKIFKAKVIIHMHGATFEDWYLKCNKFIQRIIRWILNKCDVFIILGELWKEFISTIIEETSKIRVVYNAVDVGDYRYNLDSKEIIFLGMLIERKGIDDLLVAINMIKNKLPNDIKVKLYGSDKNFNINKKIRKYKLQDIVKYEGWLTSENRECCFSNAIINILPSYNEGLPMTIVETMAFGIPNISTNIAAIPEIIEHGENGILIPPGNTKLLGESILTLINDGMLRSKYSRKSYEKVKAEFNLSNQLYTLKAIYKSL